MHLGFEKEAHKNLPRWSGSCDTVARCFSETYVFTVTSDTRNMGIEHPSSAGGAFEM